MSRPQAPANDLDEARARFEATLRDCPFCAGLRPGGGYIAPALLLEDFQSDRALQVWKVKC